MLVGVIILISVTIISLGMTYVLMRRNKRLTRKIRKCSNDANLAIMTTQCFINKMITALENSGMSEDQIKAILDASDEMGDE